MKRIWTRLSLHFSQVAVLAVAALALVAAAGGAGSGASREHYHEGGNRDRANLGAGDPDSGGSDAVPIVGETSAPAAQGAAPEKISPEVAKGMLAEFQRAQLSELKALDHRNKLENREFSAAQATRQKEWERHEQVARHRFFAEHTRGPDRRAYIRDFLERRSAFMQSLAEERAQRSRDQASRASSLRKEQMDRLKQFREALGRGERPSLKLWPGSS
jgi:hypothetical protein